VSPSVETVRTRSARRAATAFSVGMGDFSLGALKGVSGLRNLPCTLSDLLQLILSGLEIFRFGNASEGFSNPLPPKFRIGVYSLF